MSARTLLDSLVRIRHAVRETVNAADVTTALNAVVMALGIVCSVWIADRLGLDNPYWAGVTAMVVAVPDTRSMLLKCLHRLLGTYTGAAVGLVLAMLTGQSLWLFVCATFVVIFAGLWINQRSAWPYAWLIGTITSVMVLAGGFLQPDNAHMIAIYRPCEVTVGTLTMAAFELVASRFIRLASLEPRVPAAPAADLTPRARFRNACSPAIAGCVTFALMHVLDIPGGLPSLISICVLALTGPLDKVQHKAMQRILGCALGAAAGLVVALGLGLEQSSVASSASYWIVMLVAAWCFSLFNRGFADCAYLALQAEVAFLIICAQSSKHVAEVGLGLTRLEGIFFGVVVFYLVESLANALFEHSARMRANA